MKRVDAEILTVDDLAELFACDKETAAARLTTGDLPGVKVGRSWIIPRQALFERLNQKALEEAATRRAHQESLRSGAHQQRGNSFQEPSGSRNSAPSALLVFNTPPNSRGRKRRQPPTLPPLPN